MSLLKKAKQRSVERKFGGTHPILRMGLDRNVIDAYFTGLVFAAVADDENIDDAERQKLEKIGLAMNVSDDDIAAMMSDMLSRDSDAKIAVAEECANALQGTPTIPMFVCEWSQVWMSHAYKQDELDDFRAQLCEWLGVDGEKEFYLAFDAISSGAAIDTAMLHRLTARISEDDLLYLCADRADEIKRILDAERVQKEQEEEERARKELARKVEIARLKQVRKDFEKALDEIGEQYQERASVSYEVVWDIEPKLAVFSKDDIDWGEAISHRIEELRTASAYPMRDVIGIERGNRKTPLAVRSGRLSIWVEQKKAEVEKIGRRKVIWKLVGMLAVAGKGIRRSHLGDHEVNDLLESARRSSEEHFREKVESFVNKAFSEIDWKAERKGI